MAKTSENKSKIEKKESSIDVRSWDELQQKIAYPELVHVQYSNAIQVQASDADIYIDFQQLPGHIKDEKIFVDVTRIYLTKDKARNFAGALSDLIKRMDENNK
jgi:hypothetical protein